MTVHQPTTLDLFRPPAGKTPQFRLSRLQTFNWGTFSNYFDFPVSETGFLFVGPSGSGKSTILDAHTALLTPPKWLDFNVAAREAERQGRDRSAMTYLRGAWAEQTAEGGEYVRRFLRTETTWSAIAETYRDGQGRNVVLAQILWVRGKSVVSTDVKKIFLVFDRPFELRELEFFPKSDFDVRRFKHDLADAFVRDEFSPYQERFRRLLGIDSERALRLLHKTQSAKNLGDLNTFLRDFMLDAPETFSVAERLVDEFGELNAAHQAVVAARRQIETLKPARDESAELQKAGLLKSELQELSFGVDQYREQRRKILLQDRLAQLGVELEGAGGEVERLAALRDQEFGRLRDLQERHLGLGGGLIEQLQEQIQKAEEERKARLKRRETASAACRVLDVVLPETPAGFAEVVELARRRLLAANAFTEDLEKRQDELKVRHRDLNLTFQAVVVEVKAMERQRSNIPAALLDLRRTLAAAIGVAEEKVPFAGELLEVRAEELAWQGAIERVLGGFALSLLVEERHYAAFAAHVNDRYLGKRLVYLRVIPPVMSQRIGGSQNVLGRKLSIAGGPYSDWLREELRTRFDYECTDTVAAFRAAQRAVTLQGQIKHNASRHEKDDRFRIDDRTRWVLGFDNAHKLELFKKRAFDLATELEGVVRQLEKAKTEGKRQHDQLLACQTLSNLTWTEIDVATSLRLIAALGDRLAGEKDARPELSQLERQIAEQSKIYESSVAETNSASGRVKQKEAEIVQCKQRLKRVADETVWIQLTPLQKTGLDQRFAALGKALTLDSLDGLTTQVVRALGVDTQSVDGRMSELRFSIERHFADFIREWPAESGGLDPTIASAEDFFAKLDRLQSDGLPRFEARFFDLLREQSDQNLTQLAARLDQERKAIRDRMKLVNDSLEGAPFNDRTYLVIETQDRMLEQVRTFKQSLRDALSHSFGAEREQAEKRFGVLSTLVSKLSSQEAEDRRWRSLVLDVRQHVEFVARELDEADNEIEVYRSGAGKSGGQRQKLAATCLAAALRYQLGGHDSALPSFSTVALDEAFDKADADFTTMAMNIFKTFGFQMVVATPLKSVMTLEPFIGGACFVHIKERKVSMAVMIELDPETKRLKLPGYLSDGEETTSS